MPRHRPTGPLTAVELVGGEFDGTRMSVPVGTPHIVMEQAGRTTRYEATETRTSKPFDRDDRPGFLRRYVHHYPGAKAGLS
jgi:hypothetical protein